MGWEPKIKFKDLTMGSSLLTQKVPSITSATQPAFSGAARSGRPAVVPPAGRTER